FRVGLFGSDVSLRTASTSTMPRHSPLFWPRKDTNCQRSATRLLNARNMISAHRPVVWALTARERTHRSSANPVTVNAVGWTALSWQPCLAGRSHRLESELVVEDKLLPGC